jgi:hypothetical protein
MRDALEMGLDDLDVDPGLDVGPDAGDDPIIVDDIIDDSSSDFPD